MQQLVSPGALTAKHAKFESKCESCHLSFDKGAQTKLCLDCHKEVAADYKAAKGFHGRITPLDQPCTACHTDHQGREKNIVVFNAKDFDHKQTDYQLNGAHSKVACASCHVQGHPFREAPPDCATCHRAKEPHKGQLKDCQSCHNDTDWKAIAFDHDQTKFRLIGAHAKKTCDDCHADQHWRVETTCISCHRDKEPHMGQLTRCESCHDQSDWKQVKFDHATTKFVLAGEHARTKCADCHADEHWQVQTTCISCHKKDDAHQGRLSENCASCHSANNWQVGKFDHARTKFPLLGKHADVKCETCHVQDSAKVRIAVDCESCHQKDDTHRGGFGVKCESCHDAKDWKTAKFDHTKATRFPLLGKHAPVKCADCHAPGADATKTAVTCLSCHQKDDVHANQLGANCQSCHNDRGWAIQVVFDHDLVRFPLIGKHADLTCDKCHETKRYKDAPVPCIDCHRKDDEHKAALGTECGTCHNPVDWKAWTFDHDMQTKFALTGAHMGVDCAQCHKPNEKALTICADCHRADDIHQGRFGADCGRCHTAASFKALRNRF